MSDEAVPNSECVPNPHAIARIVVEKLFGQFTYQLPPRGATTQDLSNLFILYGDNGSGKTTVLRLLLHLLSPEDGKGHKLAVSKIRFRRFAVELADGTTIEALRPGASQEGSFRAAILRGTETIDAVDFRFGAGSEVKEEEKARSRSFLENLRNLGLSLHFLPDDRRVLGRNEDEEEFMRRRWRGAQANRHLFTGINEEEEDSPSLLLRTAVDRATSWIRQQALTGSNRGQRGVHSIYTDITRQIAESLKSQTAPETHQQQIDDLITDLTSLSERSSGYSKLGFTSDLPVETIVGTLEKATPATQAILYNVVGPYVQSINARLKALEGIHTLVQLFTRNINAFFGSTKTLSYDLREGFAIVSNDGDPLTLEMLSSGERQLLLLMCNTIANRD